MKTSHTPKATGIQMFPTSSAATRRRNNYRDPPALHRIPLKTCANSPPQAPLLNLVLEPESNSNGVKLANDLQDISLVKSQSQMPNSFGDDNEAAADAARMNMSTNVPRNDCPSENEYEAENAKDDENASDVPQVDLKTLNDSTLKVLDSILETNIQVQVTSPSSASRTSKDITSTSLVDGVSDEDDEDDENYGNSPRCRSRSIASSESDLVSYGTTESAISSVGGEVGTGHNGGSGKNSNADEKGDDEEYSFLVSDGDENEDEDGDDSLGSQKDNNPTHRIISKESGLDDQSLSEILDSGSSYCETENNGNVSMVLEPSFFSEGIEVSHSYDDEFAYEKRMARMEMKKGRPSIGTDNNDGDGTNKAANVNDLNISQDSSMRVNPLSNHALEEVFARGGEAALDRALRLNDTPGKNVAGIRVYSSPGLNQDHLRASLKSALMELASLKEEKKWFESSLEARVEKSIEMGCSLDEANDLIRSMQRNEKELDREMNHLKRELERKSSERTSLLQELSQNKGEVSSVKEVLADTKLELSQIWKKNEELEKIVESQQKELAKEQDRCLRAEVMLVKANNELSESKRKNDDLEEENEILKEDIAMVEDKSQEAKRQLEERKNELDVTKSILESLGKRVNSDDEEFKKARSDLIKAQNQITSLVKEKEAVCSEKDSSLSRLKSKLHQGQTELNTLKTKYQCSEKIAEAIGQSLNEANERIKSIERESGAAREKHDQEINKLRTAFVQKDAEVVNRQFEISQHTRQKNKLEREIASVKKEVETVQSRCQAVETELQKEKGNVDLKNTEISHIQQRFEQSEDKCAEIGRSLGQAREQRQRASEIIHKLQLELELVHKARSEALLFIPNPCSSNRADGEKQNHCCFFPFGKKRVINITTSSNQEVYEKLISCIEDALTKHRQELGLSQRTIDVLLQCSDEDHYQDDNYFDDGFTYEINNGEIQMLNGAPLQPSFRELCRRMIIFYRESIKNGESALALPQPVLDTLTLRLIQNEVNTSNCLEWLQAVGDDGIRDILGRSGFSHSKPGYVAPELESVIPLEEETTNNPESTPAEDDESERLLDASNI